MAYQSKSVLVFNVPEPKQAGEFQVIRVDKAFEMTWLESDLGRSLFENAVMDINDLGPTISRYFLHEKGMVRGTGLSTHKPWVYWEREYSNRRVLYTGPGNVGLALIDINVYSRFTQGTNSYAVSTLLKLDPYMNYKAIGEPMPEKISIRGDSLETIGGLADMLSLPYEFTRV